MKKALLLILSLISLSAHATLTPELIDIRKNISDDLNNATKQLKKDFSTVDSTVKQDEEDLEKLKQEVDNLKDSSKDDEVNPTILLHGKKQVKECSDIEELYWTGLSWQCRTPNYATACEPSTKEDLVCDEDGNCTCKQPGTYSFENLGWGACKNEFGERETQIGCMFKNSKDMSSYQVDSNLCPASNITRYEQACGPNGAISSCKCPNNGKYVFKDNKPYCLMTTSCDEANGYYYSSVRNRCEKPAKMTYRVMQDYNSCPIGVEPVKLDKENSVIHFGGSNGKIGNINAHMHSTKRVIEITPQEVFYGIKIVVNNDGNPYTFNAKSYTSNVINLNNKTYLPGKTYRFEFIKSSYVMPNSYYVFTPSLYFETRSSAPSVCSSGEFNEETGECLISIEENIRCEIK
ncbi:MAG: hypothetical protein CFH44_00912 [Proteobacteria bacterium]|nr:MAG: hypothetical protein CFH44_00912 [Pseudomonadota bacterium]